ncbi:hypothetical protein GCM10028812_54020 [Ancylobacter sonchi]
MLDEGIRLIPYEFQQKMKLDSRLKWCRVPNIGPYRKLLPLIADPILHNSLIATADDDTIYPSDWLSTLVYYYHRYNCVIAFRGHRMLRNGGVFAPYRRWMKKSKIENPSIYNIGTGKDGILYHPSFFSDSVTNIFDAITIAKTSDDLWFKWHTAINRVSTYLINQDYRINTFPGTGVGPNLYSNFNVDGANDKAVAELEKYFERKYGITIARLMD